MNNCYNSTQTTAATYKLKYWMEQLKHHEHSITITTNYYCSNI